MAGHVESVRPPFNTCKTKSFESKSVEERSNFTGLRWFSFPAYSLAEMLSCLQKTHLTFSDRFLISPGQRRSMNGEIIWKHGDGVIWLAGVIDKRSNKRIWTTLVAKFIVSKISEIHLARCSNRDSTVQLTDLALHRTHSRALTECWKPFKNHSFQ